MIKGVLFDYGGVVADGGKGIELAKRLSIELKLPNNAIDAVLAPLFGDYVRGKIDDDTFWTTIETKTDTKISVNQRQIWDSWWGVQPYRRMIELIEKLKSDGYPVGLLSNVFPPTKEVIESSGGYSIFDFRILSCEVGYAKPDLEIYNLALSKFTDLQPDEIVFIDDQQKCMRPARELGIQTILATSTDQILAELRKLGLPV